MTEEYRMKWLEEMYQEKRADWMPKKLTRKKFEAEYKEEIFYKAQHDWVTAKERTEV